MWLTANPCPEAGLRAQVAWVLNSRGEAALTARRAASDPLAYTEDTIVRVRGLLAAVDCDSGGLNAGYGWPTQRCRIFVLVGPTYLTSGRRLGRTCGCPGRRFAAAGIACICRRETRRANTHWLTRENGTFVAGEEHQSILALVPSAFHPHSVVGRLCGSGSVRPYGASDAVARIARGQGRQSSGTR